jgi:hypothetical protein
MCAVVPALPAAAAVPPTIYLLDVVVAPGAEVVSELRVGGFSGEVVLDIDASGIADIASVEISAPTGWTCDALRCVTSTEESGQFALTYAGVEDAEPGDSGPITVELGGATLTRTVTVGAPVDLGTPATIGVEGEPGTEVGVQIPLTNAGDDAARGAVLLMELSQYAGAFVNCERFASPEEFYHFDLCTFDEALAPGATYALSDDLPFPVDALLPTGSTVEVTATWFTPADWAADGEAYRRRVAGHEGVPGTGPELDLVGVQADAGEGPQTDTNRADNTARITITVTGANFADLAATGDTVSGAVGAVVDADVGLRNLGPAILEPSDTPPAEPILRFTVPAGTTAVRVPDNCAPFIAGRPWDLDDRGEPGASAYGCLTFFLEPGAGGSSPFGLRIDEVIPNATGQVSVVLAGDPNAANDTAPVIVNPAGTGGGGGEPGLPVTGPAAGLIAGMGVLLVAGGVIGLLLARRRRPTFQA